MCARVHTAASQSPTKPVETHLRDVDDQVHLALLDVLDYVGEGATVQGGGRGAVGCVATLRLRQRLSLHLF